MQRVLGPLRILTWTCKKKALNLRFEDGATFVSGRLWGNLSRHVITNTTCVMGLHWGQIKLWRKPSLKIAEECICLGALLFLSFVLETSDDLWNAATLHQSAAVGSALCVTLKLSWVFASVDSSLRRRFCSPHLVSAPTTGNHSLLQKEPFWTPRTSQICHFPWALFLNC